jgi:uncharacterized repeat protein (TIGR03803 family)
MKSNLPPVGCLTMPPLAVRYAVTALCLLAMTTSAQTYKVLHHFSGTGPRPLVACGETLFGAVAYSTEDNGMLFKISMDGSAFEVLKRFNGSDGAGPVGALVVSGSSIYGNTMGGGLNSAGTVFRLEADGTGHTVLTHLPGGTKGWAPEGTPLVLGTYLYGTTVRGGAWDCGVLFRVNKDGSDFTVIKSFGDAAGGNPEGFLASDGNALYGATSASMGTIYKINPDGSGCAVLKKFTGPDGDTPFSGVVLSGTTLY